MVEEYKYNGRIWRVHPTRNDENGFFHAAFGKGLPCVDKDAKFRRDYLRSYFAYFFITPKPDGLKKWLETVPGIKESDENYRGFARSLCNSEHRIVAEEIPIIAALENTAIVLFTNDKTAPKVFAPERDLLGDYPWKVKTEIKETLIAFRENNYSRLQFDRFEETTTHPQLDESVIEEVTEAVEHLHLREYYAKLSGCAGIKGSLYQIDILTIFLLNEMKSKTWQLSTENTTADKFDDVVLEVFPNEAFLLQAKHRRNKPVNYEELYRTESNKDDFSLAKYYLSYQEIKNTHRVKKLTLCTNAGLRFPKGCAPPEIDQVSLDKDDFLYYKNMQSCCYTFNDSTIPRLIETSKIYKENNLKDKQFHNEVFAPDQVKQFLSLFQLVTKYPEKGDLDTVIEKKLIQTNYCSRFETKNCAKYLNDKVMEWFETDRGKYLNHNNLLTFLAEFRSKKFCEKLLNFQMDVKGRDVDYCNAKRILRIESSSYLLNMVKVYSTLYCKDKKYLFLDPNENVKTQLDMLKIFGQSSHEFLVAHFKDCDSSSAAEISKTLTDLIKNSTYKRLILVTGRYHQVADSLKEQNEGEYEEIFENITFRNLTEVSRSKLLTRVVQVFHESI